MKEILEVFLNRRSTRKYSEQKVTEEELKAVVACGLSSPTGHGHYAGEVIVVTEREIIDRLCGSRTGSANMLKGADAALVVIGDGSSDTWVEDCSAIMTSMHLASDAMGLGSCWIQGRNRVAEDGRTSEEYVRDIIGYPEDKHLEGILSLGHVGEHLPVRTMDDLKWEKVSRNQYGKGE